MKNIDLSQDIYYQKKYASIYLAEGEKLFEFNYQNGLKKFYNISIKRPIKRIGSHDIDDEYFDLETAYGYGGYLSTSEDKSFLDQAFAAYQQKCIDERVIAEFIRFHPYNTFPVTSASYLDFVHQDRQTVSINLSLTKENRWLEYSSTTRNILRKAGLQMIFQESPNIDKFMAMYRSSMEKNKAHSFYYFPRNYYEKLLATKCVKLFSVILNSQTVCMSFILFGKNLAHYHLSANDIQFQKLCGNYFLLDSACDFLKIQFPEILFLHLGGGKSNLSSDSLFSFKSKFSRIRNSFYIAGKIFNHSVYQKYVKHFNEHHPQQKDSKYFLKYRQGTA